MTFPIQLGVPFLVQEVVSGTGVFDGTEQGRASVTVNPLDGINSRVIVRAKRYGSAFNAYTVKTVDPGVGINYPATTVALVGSLVEIKLRRTVISIQATAAEVATAVNAFSSFSFPVCAEADPAGSGAGIVSAAGPVSLAGGQDPAFGPDPNGQFKWVRAPNTNGGFFFFEQDEPIVLRKFEARMLVTVNPTPIKFEVVNLNAARRPIMAERGLLLEADMTPSQPYVSMNDIRDVLLPFQAILVTCTVTGFVRFSVQREGKFPLVVR